MTWTQKALLLIGSLLVFSWEQGSEYLSAAACQARDLVLASCPARAFSGPTPAAVLISLVRDCGVAVQATSSAATPSNPYSRSLSL